MKITIDLTDPFNRDDAKLLITALENEFDEHFRYRTPEGYHTIEGEMDEINGRMIYFIEVQP